MVKEPGLACARGNNSVSLQEIAESVSPPTAMAQQAATCADYGAYC